MAAIVRFDRTDVISSRREYGNNDQINVQRIFQPPVGYQFKLDTVQVTTLSTDGTRGFGDDFDGPFVDEMTATMVKVRGTTRHHTVGTSGHIEFKVTADMVKV